MCLFQQKKLKKFCTFLKKKTLGQAHTGESESVVSECFTIICYLKKFTQTVGEILKVVATSNL